MVVVQDLILISTIQWNSICSVLNKEGSQVDKLDLSRAVSQDHHSQVVRQALKTPDFISQVWTIVFTFKRNFSCIIWEYACAFNDILISSAWNKLTFFLFFFLVGGGVGEWGGRCDINLSTSPKFNLHFSSPQHMFSILIRSASLRWF